MQAHICPSCGYDLRAQITKWGARCPECGCGYTVEELQRHARPRRWRGLIVPIAAVIVPPWIIIAMIWIGFLNWYENWPSSYSASLFVMMGATPVAHQLLAMRWCDRFGWPYLFGTFIGVIMTLASVATFFASVYAVVIVIACLYGW